jgi:hypothetical protein
MDVTVYLPLIVPAFAALAARPAADRLPPAAATWLLTAAALVLACSSCAVLGLLAFSALVRLPFVAQAGDLSLPVIGRSDAVPLPVEIAAAGALVLVAVTAGRAVLRRGAALAAAHRHAQSLPGAGQVVVTEDAAADAYTLPGWPCRIVVTRGMLSALSAREREVLLAHERAHAAASHYLFTSAARLASAASPMLRPVADQVAYTVERWADERAAAQTGDRSLAARAIARAALATKAAPPARAGTMSALGMVVGPPGLRGAGPVPRRVAALLAPALPSPLAVLRNPRSTQPLLLASAVLLLTAVSAASALDAAAALHHLIELAQGVPS